MSDLKPCPKCGGRPSGPVRYLDPSVHARETKARWMVSCVLTRCSENPMIAGHTTPEAAIAAWNRREVPNE